MVERIFSGYDGYLSPPAVADIDGDGNKEIIVTAKLESGVNQVIFSITMVTCYPAGLYIYVQPLVLSPHLRPCRRGYIWKW